MNKMKSRREKLCRKVHIEVEAARVSNRIIDEILNYLNDFFPRKKVIKYLLNFPNRNIS